MDAPFQVGDLVVLAKSKYYRSQTYLNNIVRKVVKVRPSSRCFSGWLVSVDGPNAHVSGGKNGILDHDSGWFKRVPDKESDRRRTVLSKISEGIKHHLDDRAIEQSLQRHVPKVELIGIVRYLLG